MILKIQVRGVKEKPYHVNVLKASTNFRGVVLKEGDHESLERQEISRNFFILTST